MSARLPKITDKMPKGSPACNIYGNEAEKVALIVMLVNNTQEA